MKRNWLQIIRYRLWLYHDEHITFRDIIPKKLSQKELVKCGREYKKEGWGKIAYCPYCRELSVGSESCDSECLLKCYICGRNKIVKLLK